MEPGLYSHVASPFFHACEQLVLLIVSLRTCLVLINLLFFDYDNYTVEETDEERQKRIRSTWSKYIKFNAAMKAFRQSGAPRPDLGKVPSDPPEKVVKSAFHF